VPRFPGKTGAATWDCPRLCREWAQRSDLYRHNKTVIGFGPGGRQPAYNDALRDLVTPTLGHPPVIRVAAPGRDGLAAYASVRARLREATGDS
jgi:hypothetical protein